MLKLNISYDIEKDIKNYSNIVFGKYPDRGTGNSIDKSSLFPFQKEAIQSAKDENELQSILADILEKWQKKNELVIKLNSESLYNLWENKKHIFIEGLNNIYGKILDFPEISVYFATLSRCPYNFRERWFMAGIRSGLEQQIATSCHELSHFLFFEHFTPYCKDKLNSVQLDSLKEALTVFLNAKPFSEIISVYDKGYPGQKALRSFLWQEYSKNPNNFNFQEVLDKIIDLKDSLLL